MPDSLQTFLDMGGYAAYVWSSYGIMLAVVLGNIAWPWLRQRNVRRHIHMEASND